MDKISELMDGELDENQARRQVARVSQDAAMREAWEKFHLIGDIMRGESPLSGGFGRGFTELLSREPTVLAPQRRAVSRMLTYVLPAAASAAAIAVVAWIAFFTNPVAPVAPIAKAPASVPATEAPSIELASVPSEGTMNEYLIAHQEFSPSTEIQGVAPYIRSVSVTRPAGQ
jgi:sigma-E factor negative regulatory protein RseA